MISDTNVESTEENPFSILVEVIYRYNNWL